MPSASTRSKMVGIRPASSSSADPPGSASRASWVIPWWDVSEKDNSRTLTGAPAVVGRAGVRVQRDETTVSDDEQERRARLLLGDESSAPAGAVCVFARRWNRRAAGARRTRLLANTGRTLRGFGSVLFAASRTKRGMAPLRHAARAVAHCAACLTSPSSARARSGLQGTGRFGRNPSYRVRNNPVRGDQPPRCPLAPSR
jgi:hypothetical protein